MFTWFVIALLSNAQAAQTCGVDQFEPNNERARSKSTRNKLVKAQICKEDTDWYYLRLDEGVEIDVKVVADKGRVCAAPDLYAPRKRKPVGAPYKAATHSGVRFKTKQAGKHRVRVQCDGEEVAYTLEVVQARVLSGERARSMP